MNTADDCCRAFRDVFAAVVFHRNTADACSFYLFVVVVQYLPLIFTDSLPVPAVANDKC